MNKFLNKLKKTCFWPSCPILGTKLFFQKSISHLEKVNDPTPIKCSDRQAKKRMVGRKNGKI